MRSFWIVLFILLQINAVGQYFQFSMYDMSAQRVNPALGAISEYGELNFLYRNQLLPESQSLQSTYLEGVYPVQYSRSLRAAYGLSALDDRYGIAGIYRTNMVGLSYAMALQVAEGQYLSLGMKGDWQSRSVSLGGLTTGSQYLQDRGFVGGSGSEPLEDFSAGFFTGSMGLYWSSYGGDDKQKAHLGLSLYDLNEPAESFYNESATLPKTWVVMAGIEAFSKNKVSLYPELLFTRSSTLSTFNVGINTIYDISQKQRDPARLIISTKCATGRRLIVGVQIARKSMVFGCSGDIPVADFMGQPAFEVSVKLRRLVAPRRSRSRRSIMFRTRRPDSTENAKEENQVTGESDSTALDKEESDNPGRVIYVYPGQVTNIPPLTNEDTISFNFPTNESMLNGASVDVLKVMVQFLKENPHLKVVVRGHTDDVGSYSSNYRLGMRRANEVAEFFMENDIWKDRIQVESDGENNPQVPNNSAANRAKNRRVEVIFSF